MIKTLEKKNDKKNIDKKSTNTKIKNIVKTYLELGLVDGYIDKNGKTILSKEVFDDWD